MRVAVRMRAVEVYRFHPLTATLIAVVALLLQGYLPLWFPSFSVLDLPLLVTIYFSLSRRSQVSGMFIGAAIGLAQDSLSHNPIGLYGISKTLVGYLASSMGGRIDSEHPGIRLLLTFTFYYVHLGIITGLERVLLERHSMAITLRTLAFALINAILGLLIYRFLDRFKKPA